MVPGRRTNSDKGLQILYKFYSKPVTNKLGILKKSAMPEGLKVATIAQEVLRRLRTTSEDVSKEISEEILIEYMDNLRGMGCDHK